MRSFLFLLIFILVAISVFLTPCLAVAATADITVGQTVTIQPDGWYPVAFQFSDGRISVRWTGETNAGKWSTDGGRTWSNGPTSPYGASIELEGNEVLSLDFPTKKRADGKYTLPQRRSLDGWKTFAEETGILDIPQSVACGGDGGETNEGFLMDHGMMRLNDGRLMATMYGNYDEDKTLADGYPKEFNCRKYRAIVVFSSDKGKTWGNPRTVAAATAISHTHEGPCEADLTRAANGDILCAMRTGGRPGDSSPCCVSRSTDEGQTWNSPVAILDRGVWPHLLTMSSGVVVCTTGRDGDWLVVSTDNGHTWQEGFRFYDGGPYPSCSSYNSIFEVAPNTILVIYDRQPKNGQGHEIVGTFFTVTPP
jgi:hypothetical protein